MDQVLNELEIEKKRGEDLTQVTKASQSQHWCRAPIDDLSPHQLANLKVGLEGLKKQVMQQAQKFMVEASDPPQYFPGSSSTGGINQFDPTNTNSNLSSENIMPPPPPLPMIQSSAHPQDFSNDIGFNPPTMDMVPPSHMIQSSAPSQYFPGSSRTGGILQFDATNTNSNLSNENMMPPPPLPMIQSSAHPQDFSNTIGFNPPTMNTVPPAHMIQSSAPSQYYPGSSRTGGNIPFDPNNIAFNPLNTNMHDASSSLSLASTSSFFFSSSASPSWSTQP